MAFKYELCLYILTNYHCMILIDIFVVLSKLFALIKFKVTYDCQFSSFFLFFYFFGIFAEIRQTFRRSVVSARWLFGKMSFRRSGFRQSVVHRIRMLHRMLHAKFHGNWPTGSMKEDF